MNYQEFCIKYQGAFTLMNTYTAAQAGRGIYCERLAELADDYPEFCARFEAELEDEYYAKA